MPYDAVPGSTDPTTLDGGVYSPIPNDPAILIETLVESSVAAAAVSAAAAAASAAAALASQNAANASAIAASASESAAAGSASAASASASTASTAATSAAGSAAAASTSATNAGNSASAASASASEAATSATNSANSASASSASASAAAASAAAALISENNAAASFVAMDQKYLGAKAANPTVNNQGGALAAGMLYFNTGSNELRMYTGSAWIGIPGVLSFNSRTGAVTLTSSDVTTALGFTPVDGSAYLPKAGGTMTGALLGIAGTVGAPGFSFSGDTSNGWWAPAADTQAWSIAGAEALRLNSAGFGVGAAPLRKFWVQTGAASAIGFEQDADGLGLIGGYSQTGGVKGLRIAGSAGLYFSGNGANVTQALLDTSGNIGFGLTPVYKVDALAGDGNGYRYSNGTQQVLFGTASARGAVGTISNHAFSILMNTGEAARFPTTGGLLLNSPTSGFTLDVSPSANGANTPTARFGGTNRPFYVQPGLGANAVYGPAIGFGAYADTSVASPQYVQPSGIGMQGGALITGPYGGGLDFYTYNAGAETGTSQLLSSTLRMSITGSGLVFVNRNTDSGYGVLQVNSGGSQVADFLGTTAAYVNVRVGAGAIAGIRLGGNATTPGSSSFDLQQDSSSNVDIINRSNTRMSFYTNGAEVLRLTAGGLAQLGLFSGGAKLNINGGATAWGQFYSSTSGTNYAVFLRNDGSTVLGYLGSGAALVTSGAQSELVLRSEGDLILSRGTTVGLRLTSSGSLRDGSGLELGWRRVPQSSTTSGNLVAADAAKHVSASGGVTVPASVFSIGDAVTVFNNTTGNITITQGASTTLRLAGTALTGNRTLAQRGLATILCVGTNVFVISGAGLS